MAAERGGRERGTAEHREDIRGPRGATLTIEWFRRGRGLFGLDKWLPRERASHGRVTERHMGKAVRQWIEPVADVDRIVAEVRTRWESRPDATLSGGPTSEGHAVPTETGSPARPGQPAERPRATPRTDRRGRSFVPACRYCDLPTIHHGERSFVEQIRLSPNLAIDQRRTRFDLYVCEDCGSVELFDLGRE